MLKWFRNAKLASAAGFVIFIVLIWFAGPLVGLQGKDTRLVAIVGVMLLWVVTLMIGRLVADRASSILEKMLRRQADDAVMGASADRRAEVARLRQRLLAAIDTVKNSNLGKARGKAALYELPWYMVIGHSAAGKSSAIFHSGLSFPFGDKQAIQGVGGTRDCDWFFSTEGVLLDTAGRYSTQREDRAEWLGFLKLLKKYRPKAPVNGILVAISFPELVQFRSEQFELYARQIRERIDEVDNAFGMKVPVYLVFTKIDLLGGFAQFFTSLSEEERQQVWGATLSCDQGSDFNARYAVLQQFDTLLRGLTQMARERLAGSRGTASHPALFAFPIEFHGMRESIGKFVELLFQEDPYHSKPLLRGFYFTSALQDGVPRVETGNRVARRFDLAQRGFDASPLPASNGYFLRNLFREVVFADQHLVMRQSKPINARLRIAGIGASLCVLAVLTGALTWSYVGNRKLIDAAEEELRIARQLKTSNALADRLKGLQVLQLRIEQLYRFRNDGAPFSLRMHLYQGDRIEAAMRAEYFAGVRTLMLDPVKQALENRLSGLKLTAVELPVAPASDSIPVSSKPAASAPSPRRPHPSRGSLPIIPLSRAMERDDMPHLVLAGFNTTAALPEAFFSRMPAVRTVSASSPIQDSAAKTAVAVTKLARKPDNADEQTHDNSLEDSYNALKTYLMLHERARMDVAHLSDQIPRYWRAWLEVNKGNGSMDEINRLAERVVAFYVAQIKEADLPTIDNRGDLVADARDTLRSAMHKLSARERVYNELKARANTEFPSMTVGRMLNNADLTTVIGSHAVPGAFTREAWEKYMRNAIAEASRGEVKGDDWVLAAATQENLGKNGDVERNRKELEALYKADYIREWKTFLQGIAVQDFGSIDIAAQSLGKLADPQNSPIRLILSRAAQETSWDNPSAVSQSIENVKTSVIERTEKLILGTNSSAVPSSHSLQYGDIGNAFAQLSSLTMQAGEGGKAPLAAYLEMLAKLKTKVAQMAANGDAETAARQLMQATLAGSGSELSDALALVDGPLLGSAPDDTKETVRPLLVRPLMQTYAALIPLVERGLNQAWQAEVFGAWRSLAAKYPFSDASNEASMADIAKILRPQEGLLPKFIDKNLSGLVVKRGDTLVTRTWAGLGVNFNPSFLAGAAKLGATGSAALQEGDGAQFELQPIPTPGISEMLVEIGGQVMRYRNGPQVWTAFSWPSAAGANSEGARIQVVSFSGASASVANFSGRLGLMRMLGQARMESISANMTQLAWCIKPAGMERVALQDRPAACDASNTVRVNFRLVSGANPLSMSALRHLSLPEKIAN
jgi:type VI secretion system protein ImpL